MEEKFKSEEQLYEYLKTQREKEVDRHKRNLKSQLEKVLKIILKTILL